MTAIILNIILILLELWALRPVWHRKWKNLVFYTQISNLLATLSAIAFLIFPGSLPVTVARYCSVCMMVMTGLVTALILVPMGGDPKVLLWGGSGLFHHVICPVLTTVSYVFFEKHVGFAFMWVPMAVTLIYGLVMLALNGKGMVDGPYPFFRVRHQSAAATVIWTTALIGLIGAISALICIVAR